MTINLRLSGLGFETNKTCALKSIEQNTVNIPDIMIEMDTLTHQMQNNLQEFIFASLKLSVFGAHKFSSDSSWIFEGILYIESIQNQVEMSNYYSIIVVEHN